MNKPCIDKGRWAHVNPSDSSIPSGLFTYEELIELRRQQILYEEVTAGSPGTLLRKRAQWKAEEQLGVLHFAQERQLDLSSCDWMELAIKRAAMEHPLIMPKGRGRPKFDLDGVGLIFKDLTADQIIDKVEWIIKTLILPLGGEDTDINVVRTLVYGHYAASRRLPDHSKTIKRQMTALVQQITAARSRTGRVRSNHYKKPIKK